FFSSRSRHTRFSRDWSSDVCSSDLGEAEMKITDIRFGMLRVPLKTPFKTALRTVEQVEDVVVMVHTDTGQVGYGSAPATAVITEIGRAAGRERPEIAVVAATNSTKA